MAESGKYPLFISFERRDSGGWSMLLYEQLRQRFGEGTVFRDAQEIRAGEPWKASLRRHVEGCRGLVLVIGRDWCEPRMLEKLSDPEGWVRREVETALRQGKAIFPVLVGGAKTPPLSQLPQAISTALDDYNHFQFHDGPTWQQGLDHLCADIAERTGLKMRSRQVSGTPKLYDRVLARLDRNRQANHLRQAFASGGQLFLAIGQRKGGFRHFAMRCALEVLESESGGEAPLPIPLNWMRFADLDSPSDRRVALLRDVAEALLKERGGQDDRRLLERINRKVRQTPRPTVLYSTVTPESTIDPERMDEWFAVWREIFRGAMSRRVIVILFLEERWWSSVFRSKIFEEGCDSAIQPRLGVVRRTDLRQWLESDVRNYAQDDRLWGKIKRQCDRMYRWRRSRCFDDIGEAVIDTWSTTGQG